MNIRALLQSNRALLVVGMCMGGLGLLDGFVQLRHGKPGFAAFTCVVAVYYLRRARGVRTDSSSASPFDTRIVRRAALLFFGLSLAGFCAIEIGVKVPWLSDNRYLAYVVAIFFGVTFMAAWMCGSVVLLRYVRDKFSRW
jgi:hypothetical protein